MLDLVDIFYDRSNKEFYGILDTDINMLVYVTYYDLQKKYHNSPIIIEGVTHTNLNSVGLKLTSNLKSKLYNPKNQLFTKWLVKPFVEYDKIKEYTIKKIPFGYRIEKDSIIYTFQNSARMGICWHAHLCFPLITSNYTIKVEKTLLGYPVLDLSSFFVEKAFTGNANVDKDNRNAWSIGDSWRLEYANIGIKIQKRGLLDFSQLDFKGIQDITDFLNDYICNISLDKFDLEDVHYCSGAFNPKWTNTEIIEDFQIIDISNCKTIPFVLSEENFFVRSSIVQVFVIAKNEWIEDRLTEIEAVNLGNYIDKEQLILKVKKIQGSYALMNKKFEKLIFYSTKN